MLRLHANTNPTFLLQLPVPREVESRVRRRKINHAMPAASAGSTRKHGSPHRLGPTTPHGIYTHTNTFKPSKPLWQHGIKVRSLAPPKSATTIAPRTSDSISQKTGERLVQRRKKEKEKEKERETKPNQSSSSAQKLDDSRLPIAAPAPSPPPHPPSLAFTASPKIRDAAALS